MISNAENIFRSFTEENIHYRRGLGLIVIKGQIENALKKPFKSYGKPDKMASAMISVNCRTTSDSARRYLLKKINMIENGELCSSPRLSIMLKKDYPKTTTIDDLYHASG